jgi:Na+/proline symporter
LFAYYKAFPFSAEIKAFLDAKGGKANDYVFPIWITMALSPGLSGFVLAGAFAAAISSLDALLTALSQTSLFLVFGDRANEAREKRGFLLLSRGLVVFWGIALPMAAIGLNVISQKIDILNLAFGMVTYTYGPMLGVLLLALSGRRIALWGIWLGVVFSIALTAWIRPDIYEIAAQLDLSNEKIWRPQLHYAWLFPITCAVTVACGCIASLTRKGGNFFEFTPRGHEHTAR